jgi:hypothetical protein
LGEEERAGTHVALSISGSRLTLWRGSRNFPRQPLARIWYTARAGGEGGLPKENQTVFRSARSGLAAWKHGPFRRHCTCSAPRRPFKWWCIGRCWSWRRSGHGDRWSSNEPAPGPFILNSIGTLGLAATPAPPPEGSCSFSPTAMIRMSRTVRSLRRHRHRAHCSQKAMRSRGTPGRDVSRRLTSETSTGTSDRPEYTSTKAASGAQWAVVTVAFHVRNLLGKRPRGGGWRCLAGDWTPATLVDAVHSVAPSLLRSLG